LLTKYNKFFLIVILTVLLQAYSFFVLNNIDYIKNEAGFFGAIGDNFVWITLSLTLLLSAGYFVFFKGNFPKLPLVFITSGAMSNVLDRLLYGGVVDYINLKPLFVANLADLFIVLGISYFFYLMVFKKEKN